MDRPLRQLEAAVGAGVFWWDSWGPRPSDDVDAVRVAHGQLLNVPRLVPLFENRYLPAVPAAAGNPVFSWYFADVIVYARSSHMHGGAPVQAVSGRCPSGRRSYDTTPGAPTGP